MPAINRFLHLEPVYVEGSHQEFIDAIGDKIKGVNERSGAAASLVTNISHAFAFAPDGALHWSGFLTIEVEELVTDEETPSVDVRVDDTPTDFRVD